MKKFFKIIAKAIFILVIGVVSLFFLLRYLMAHPSDQSLIANFEKNQATFNELIAMIREDKGLERVDDNWTNPNDPAAVGVTNERIAKYRKMFKDLNIPRGFSSSTEPVRIELLASTSGLSISGSSKGYAFLKNKPKPIVDNLDDYISSDSQSSIAYRPISGNWYLFYEFED